MAKCRFAHLVHGATCKAQLKAMLSGGKSEQLEVLRICAVISSQLILVKQSSITLASTA